jgi:TfoX/Sxy family transcriptional regulator of competence genes
MTREAAQALLDQVAPEFLEKPEVDWGPMFGSTGLRVRGKVFAVANRAGELMVKLPEKRADELVDDGTVRRAVMREREMREWVTIPLDAGADGWRELVGEAYAYLDQITPR